MRTYRNRGLVSQLLAQPPQVVPHCLKKSDPLPPASFAPHFQPRIALYSGGTTTEAFKRNIAIANALKTSHLKADILLITETEAAPHTALPKGLICVALPPRQERDAGLDDPGHRIDMIHSALSGFQPDAVIIDNVPFGLKPEFQKIIQFLKQGNIRCILGLGDSPRYTIPEQAQRLYDQIWIYGDRDLYDLASEYNFSNLTRKKIRYTGYLQPLSSNLTNEEEGAGTNTVAFVLNENDDYARASEMVINSRLPDHHQALLITGPAVPRPVRDNLAQLCNSLEHFTLIDGDAAGDHLQRAGRIVALGNNATLGETLPRGKPLLLIPTRPAIARALKAVARPGALDVLEAHEASSDAISDWLARECSREEATLPLKRVDTAGLSHIPGLLGALLTTERRTTPRQTPQFNLRGRLAP